MATPVVLSAAGLQGPYHLLRTMTHGRTWASGFRLARCTANCPSPLQRLDTRQNKAKP